MTDPDLNCNIYTNISLIISYKPPFVVKIAAHSNRFCQVASNSQKAKNLEYALKREWHGSTSEYYDTKIHV